MRRAIVPTLLLAALAAAGPAHAGERADFELRFAEQTPATPTAWTLHLRYKAPGDPDAKPYAIRYLELRPPAGTRINVDTHPACGATNLEIQLLGDAACPPESRIGTGRLTVMTGFGPPFDPYATDLSLFSTRDGMIEVLKEPDLGVVLAIERLKLEDGALTLTPAVVPGGPPDFKIAARDIDWNMTSAGWLTTPAECPADGRWTSTGKFTFDDGATVTETSTTPCAQPAAATRRNARRARRCRTRRRAERRRTRGEAAAVPSARRRCKRARRPRR